MIVKVIEITKRGHSHEIYSNNNFTWAIGICQILGVYKVGKIVPIRSNKYIVYEVKHGITETDSVLWYTIYVKKCHTERERDILKGL